MGVVLRFQCAVIKPRNTTKFNTNPLYKYVDPFSGCIPGFEEVDQLEVESLTGFHFRPRSSPKGRSIKNVRREGEGGKVTCGQGGGVNDLADVRKMALFSIVSPCFTNTPYGRCLLKYK